MPERDRDGAIRAKAGLAVATALLAIAGPGSAAETWLHPNLPHSVMKAAPPARRGARPARPAAPPIGGAALPLSDEAFIPPPSLALTKSEAMSCRGMSLRCSPSCCAQGAPHRQSQVVRLGSGRRAADGGSLQ